MKQLFTVNVFIITVLIYFGNIIKSETTFITTMINDFLQKIERETSYKQTYIKDTTEFYDEYDFIVIGAGSGGSVVANRLTEISEWSVLLVEAGRDGTYFSDVPFVAPLLQVTDYNWGYEPEMNPNFCRGFENKRCNWPQGRAVGGTSVINFMVYARGNKHDFNRWEKFGNPGWNYENVLPYFLKSENAKLGDISYSPYHSRNGYLDVEYSSFKTTLGGLYLETARELGYNVTDPNGEHQSGFSTVQATLRNGRRCSAAKAFLKPIQKRSNFHLTKRTFVTRILIDPNTKQAYGVEFIKNKTSYRIKVRKEIILSAGAFNSPKILMLSGIGPREHLEQIGIPIVEDLKVGYNLQDHMCLGGLTFVVNESITTDTIRLSNPEHFLNYQFYKGGPFTLPGGSIGMAFVNTKHNNEPFDDYPDIELVIGSGSLHSDPTNELRKIYKIPKKFSDIFKNIRDKPAFNIVPILMRMKSRGRVKLKSSNPLHAPLLYPNYLDDERDLKVLVEGVKMAVQIGRSKSFQRYNATLHTTPYPGCEHLQFESDAYWECCIRQITITLSHYSGTCRMGPKNDPEGSVVDHTLRVHGITGLRVVDASIMPLLITGHPNAAVFMIGEKASDMIKETWLNTV